jgi:hypothetical protein
MAIDSDRPEMDAPPPPPPPPPELGTREEAFDEATPVEEEQEQEAASADLIVPRAANDDVAGASYDRGEGTPVIGRLDDTGVAAEWEGHTIIDLRANPNANEVWSEAHERGDLRPDGYTVPEPGWSPELNRDWIDSIVDNQAILYLGTEPAGDKLLSSDGQQPSVFATEIAQLQDAGYQRVGDYLVPQELATPFADRGSLSDKFNDVSPRPADVDGGGGGDDGDGTEEPVPTLEPDLGGGPAEPKMADEDDLATAKADAGKEADQLDSSASAAEADSAASRAKSEEAAARGDLDEAADLRAEADATKRDADVQRSQAHVLRKGPGM